MAGFTILSEGQVEDALKPLRHWKRHEGRIRGAFAFTDFKQAFAFMTAVAIEADAAGHHPEWSNVYNKVTIDYWTHDAGNKVTDLDIRMAAAISARAERMGAKAAS